MKMFMAFNTLKKYFKRNCERGNIKRNFKE